MTAPEHVWITSGAVALPALIGGLLLALPRATGLARALGVAGSAGSLLLFASLLADGAAGVAVAWEWAPALPVRLAWRLDVATLALAVLVSGVGAKPFFRSLLDALVHFRNMLTPDLLT